MLESTLVDRTFSQIPKCLDIKNKYISSREIPAGRRFIDILYVELNEQFNENINVLTKIASLSTKQLSILSFFINGKRKRRHSISAYFNLSWDAIYDEYLLVFIKKGLITQIGKYTFEATDWLGIVPKKLISIEAKIEDWNCVVKQAKYNTAYTSESYILFPETRTRNKSNRKEIIDQDNIGIITTDELYRITNTVKPRLKISRDKSHISDFMKLNILRSYYNNPMKWEL